VLYSRRELDFLWGDAVDSRESRTGLRSQAIGGDRRTPVYKGFSLDILQQSGVGLL
jgi:hypothetical protein